MVYECCISSLPPCLLTKYAIMTEVCWSEISILPSGEQWKWWIFSGLPLLLVKLVSGPTLFSHWQAFGSCSVQSALQSLCVLLTPHNTFWLGWVSYGSYQAFLNFNLTFTETPIFRSTNRLSIPTSFQGSCGWLNIKQAFEAVFRSGWCLTSNRSSDIQFRIMVVNKQRNVKWTYR